MDHLSSDPLCVDIRLVLMLLLGGDGALSFEEFGARLLKGYSSPLHGVQLLSKPQIWLTPAP